MVNKNTDINRDFWVKMVEGTSDIYLGPFSTFEEAIEAAGTMPALKSEILDHGRVVWPEQPSHRYS